MKRKSISERSSNTTPNAYIKSDFTYWNISKRIKNIKSETTI